MSGPATGRCSSMPSTSGPDPEPRLLVGWAITYRVRDKPAELVTETLDAAWCRTAGAQPDDIRDPIRAAWTLALLLGSQDNPDAELITVEPAPETP